LIGIIVIATVINFMVNPIAVLMPLLITRHFNGGALQLGWTDSAFGIGIIAGGLLLSTWGGFKRQVTTALVGCMGFGFGVLLVGVAPGTAFWLALSGMAVSGFMSPLTNGPFSAILQRKVAADMQGRVMALITSLVTAMTPVSMILAGPVTDHLGLQFWFRMAGIVCTLMGVVGFFIPVVMSVEDRPDVQIREAGDPATPVSSRPAEVSKIPAD
jgi:DHA3 family macrolide efflux protein-like MFS transporter